MGERANIDTRTVEGFGDEWSAYDQRALSATEHRQLFDRYFGIFPFDRLPANAEGFDMGCGSGRLARLVAPRVGRLHCFDPASKALDVARRALDGQRNADFPLAGVDDCPLPAASQDFGCSLGVLHHVPDTAAALKACTAKLKPGAPFLVYLYYAFDQRPAWFRDLWRLSDGVRTVISRLRFQARRAVTSAIAAGVYWPLARVARMVERGSGKVGEMPLSAYRDASFYTMRTDALDRFGTRLEQRFKRPQIRQMMEAAGLSAIRFSETEPFWVACGTKAA
jgi:SAM-dependent methyltransferase